MPVQPPQGLMSFPGIAQVERGHFVLTQGILPSVCTLDIEPQDPSTIPLDGPLLITFLPLIRKPITFIDCRIDKASFEYGPGGMVWRLNIMDRRWKWRFAGPGGPVSGWFNQRFDAVQPAPQPDGALGTYQLGSLNPDTIQSPYALAEMLLEAMGEKGYDISILPKTTDASTPLPEMVWDYDNPAHALQELCDRLGCRIVLRLDIYNSVQIVQVGNVPQMHDRLQFLLVEYQPFLENLSAVADPPDMPESLCVVGGRTRYQVDLLLTPVGLDVDGTVRDIWDLSYAPLQLLVADEDGRRFGTAENLGGWGAMSDSIDPDMGFQDVPGWEIDMAIPPDVPDNIRNAWQVEGRSPTKNPRYLARQTIWRWYRIAIAAAAATYNTVSKKGGMLPAPGTFPQKIPGWLNPITGEQQYLYALWQILPLEETQVLGWYDNENRWRPYDANVYGQYQAFTWDSLSSDAIENQKFWDQDFNFTQPMPVGVSYNIDRERGIVMFDEPLYLQDPDTNLFWAPVLYLRIAVRPRYYNPNDNVQTQAPDRFLYVQDITNLGGTPGAGPRILKHEELVKQVIPFYDTKNGILKTYDNTQSLNQEAQYIINAALLEYQTPQAQDISYMAILPFQCDGEVTQVSWDVGPQGATTRIAINTEVHYAVPTYRERKLIGSLARTTQTMLALQKQERKA